MPIRRKEFHSHFPNETSISSSSSWKSFPDSYSIQSAEFIHRIEFRHKFGTPEPKTLRIAGDGCGMAGKGRIVRDPLRRIGGCGRCVALARLLRYVDILGLRAHTQDSLALLQVAPGAHQLSANSRFSLRVSYVAHGNFLLVKDLTNGIARLATEGSGDLTGIMRRSYR